MDKSQVTVEGVPPHQQAAASICPAASGCLACHPQATIAAPRPAAAAPQAVAACCLEMLLAIKRIEPDAIASLLPGVVIFGY